MQALASISEWQRLSIREENPTCQTVCTVHVDLPTAAVPQCPRAAEPTCIHVHDRSYQGARTLYYPSPHRRPGSGRRVCTLV